MGRTYFPTYSLNRFGVRVTGQQATLGDVQRFPAEPTPRAAMTPTRPILGSVGLVYPTSEMIRFGPFTNGGPSPVLPGPMPVYPITTGPIFYSPPITAPPIASSGGGGATPGPVLVSSSPTEGPAPPVSSQPLPTPTVATPPQSQIIPVLVSSGGGTPSPSTSTVTAPVPTSGGLVEGIASWLSGKTMIFSYAVPNALLAGVVVLGFAWLSSSSKKR